MYEIHQEYASLCKIKNVEETYSNWKICVSSLLQGQQLTRNLELGHAMGQTRDAHRRIRVACNVVNI